MNPTPDDHARWFAEEVYPHGPSLKTYLRGAFPAMSDVEDVVQESYLRVWRARLAQPLRSSRGFLFRVARHLALDLVRRQRVSPIDPVQDFGALRVVDQAVDVAEFAAACDDLELLAAALESLPPRRREVMLLRKLEGLSQKEIAARLGLSELTVQVHIVRGLRSLAEYFQARGCRTPRA